MISVGASPRAAQALILCAKVLAMVDGRYHASIDDVIRIAVPVLRHRIIRTFEAETDNRQVEEIIAHLLETVPLDPSRSMPIRMIPSAVRGKEGRS